MKIRSLIASLICLLAPPAMGQTVIGSTVTSCLNPTVTSATYAANVVIGGLLTFPNMFTQRGSGIIQSIALNWTTAQTVSFKLYSFKASPTAASTWTDHSAAAISGYADISSTGPYFTLSNADSGLAAATTTYSLAGVGAAYATGSTNGYFVLVPAATTATTGGTTSVVSLCITVLQDP